MRSTQKRAGGRKRGGGEARRGELRAAASPARRVSSPRCVPAHANRTPPRKQRPHGTVKSSGSYLPTQLPPPKGPSGGQPSTQLCTRAGDRRRLNILHVKAVLDLTGPPAPAPPRPGGRPAAPPRAAPPSPPPGGARRGRPGCARVFRQRRAQQRRQRQQTARAQGRKTGGEGAGPGRDSEGECSATWI
ncbi:unnamed protein product [Arctia plantaginis]|uniref:Uncharacterized protein n=1 Tax=Arctia plantaginis TaxID=874455 RepID=A0A8S1AZB3_ARCPL|nr:unnamed protein product [Arctia plantaginis]